MLNISFPTAGIAVRLSRLAFSLFSLALLNGCSSGAGSDGSVWDYHFTGHDSNLSGCPNLDSDAPPSGNHFEFSMFSVLARTESRIIMRFHESSTATTLLLDIDVPPS